MQLRAIPLGLSLYLIFKNILNTDIDYIDLKNERLSYIFQKKDIVDLTMGRLELEIAVLAVDYEDSYAMKYVPILYPIK